MINGNCAFICDSGTTRRRGSIGFMTKPFGSSWNTATAIPPGSPAIGMFTCATGSRSRTRTFNVRGSTRSRKRNQSPAPVPNCASPTPDRGRSGSRPASRSSNGATAPERSRRLSALRCFRWRMWNFIDQLVQCPFTRTPQQIKPKHRAESHAQGNGCQPCARRHALDRSAASRRAHARDATADFS